MYSQSHTLDIGGLYMFGGYFIEFEHVIVRVLGRLKSGAYRFQILIGNDSLPTGKLFSINFNYPTRKKMYDSLIKLHK